MSMLTPEEESRTKDFLKFSIAAQVDEGGMVLVNRKTHQLYDYAIGPYGQPVIVPLLEKYEDNYSIPIEELDGFVGLGISKES